MRLVTALLGLLAACSTLQPIEPNRCGNRVIDVGEACDEGGETTLCTAQCRLACVDAGVGPSTYLDNPEDGIAGGFCPAGQACGVDGLCAAPSGKFRAETSFEFDVLHAEVGDIDGDNIADLVGTGATEIRIQFGDSDGAPLSSVSTLPAPSATGPFLLGNFDASGGVDLVIPTDNGVVPYYASASGTLQHRPSPTLMIPREGNVAAVDGTVAEVGGMRRPLLVYVEAQGTAAVLRDLVSPNNPELARCDTGTAAIVRRGQLAVIANGPGDLIAVAIEHTIDAGVCVFTPANPVAVTDPGWNARFYKLGAATHFGAETLPLLWANVDGDPCPELVAPTVTAAATPGTAVIDNTAGGCSFAAATVVTPSWGPATEALGAGNLDRVGTDELVTSTGVYRIDSLSAVTRLGQNIGMDRLRVADFNGDGLVDIAGTDVTGQGDTGREAVRILRTAGAPGSWQATTVVVETLRPVVQLATGDYDGDGITDLALTEAITYNAQRVPTAMAVSVIYGQRSEIPSYRVVLETDPVVIATLGKRRGSLADEDAVDDLGVAVVGLTAKVSASVLYGSAQRSLTAPLSLEGGASVAAVGAGKWANNDDLVDLVVYSDTSQYVWPQIDGGFQTTGAGAASPLAPRRLRDFAITTAATTNGGTTLVSITPSTKQAAVGGIGACVEAWTGDNVQSAGSRPTLQARNLDGVQGDEILLTSQPGPSTQPIYLFAAVANDCKLGASLVPTGHPLLGCDAATIIEASATAGSNPQQREILAVCRPTNGISQLSRFEATTTGYVSAPLPVQLPGRARRLMVGDFTGDGLEDAVSITTVGSVDFATLLVQCAQTDTSCDP